MVEVSVDGGANWRVANGTTTGATPGCRRDGDLQVVARAIDDSLNLPAFASLPSDAVAVTPPTTWELFSTLQPVPGVLVNDGQSVELGVKFRS